MDRYQRILKLIEDLGKRVKEMEQERKKIAREREKEKKESDRRISKIEDSWGRFVEGIVSPSSVKIFRKKGYKIFTVYHRRKIMKNTQVVAEIDTLLVGEKNGRKVLFIGEAKTNFTPEDVKDFVKKLNNLHKYLPEYKNYNVIGFTAGINYGEGVDKFAVKEGLYVLKTAGEIMELSVPKNFHPKIWRL